MENLTLQNLPVAVSELIKKVENLEKIVRERNETESVDDLITARQAADMLGVALGSIYNMVGTNGLTSVTLPNGRTRFSRRAIAEWMQSGQRRGRKREVPTS